MKTETRDQKEWQLFTLRAKESLRYAVTLTMKQAIYNDASDLGHWEKLTEEIASKELGHFTNLLNAKIYSRNWHRRLRGRKSRGIYFIAVRHGEEEQGAGRYWSKEQDEKSQGTYSDQWGEIHQTEIDATRKRLQNIHYHCFIDSDLSCAWSSEVKEMVEVRDLSEITQLIKETWNQVAFGTEISHIDVEDIWNHPLKHEGWSDYIQRDCVKSCDAYDHSSLNVP